MIKDYVEVLWWGQVLEIRAPWLGLLHSMESSRPKAPAALMLTLSSLCSCPLPRYPRHPALLCRLAQPQLLDSPSV